MGFFTKIKQNLNHGGVKLQLQAPASAHMQDASLDVTVTLTATEAQQTINRIDINLYRQQINNNMNTQSQPMNTMRDSISSAVDNNARVLLPNQPQTLSFQLGLNIGKATAAFDPNNPIQKVANVMGKLETMAETMDNKTYKYWVEATANIQGIAIGASASQPIQLLKPGQIGTGFNIQPKL